MTLFSRNIFIGGSNPNGGVANDTVFKTSVFFRGIYRTPYSKWFLTQ